MITKLNHKKVNETIKNLYGFSYRKGNGGMEPTNYTYFSKGEMEFFIENIAKTKNYFQTIYIGFVNYEFTKELELIELRKQIVQTIEQEYRKQTEGQGCRYTIYSEGVINDLF